ncbi:hypothetical protein MMC13_002128 [Lambiella insularis]|nr:hypothetical protein [Lambiella insularis]
MPSEDYMSDEYVATLMTKDAKDSSIKYSALGLQALLPKRPTTNAPKPNTRFLKNIIQETDSHNAALKSKETGEARQRLKRLRGGDDTCRSSRDGRLFKYEDNDAVDERPQKRRRTKIEFSAGSGKRRKEEERYLPPSRRLRVKEDEEPLRRKHHFSEVDESEPEDTRRYHRRHRDRRRYKSSSRSHSRENSTHQSSQHPGHNKDRQRRRSRTRSHQYDLERIKPHRTKHRSRPRSTEMEKSERRRRASPEASASKEAAGNEGSDSDPLEAIIGPAPPPPQPKVRARGRGTFASSSAMDTHFSAGYDPTVDVQPNTDSDNDWDQALEALRDRRRWQQQGADRLRAAGFTEEEVKKWEKGGEKGEEDVKWKGRGEGREWDRGKVVDMEGAVDTKLEWGRLKGT